MNVKNCRGLIVILPCLLVPAFLYSEPKPDEHAPMLNIAVMNLKAKETSQDDADAAADFLRSGLSQYAKGKYKIIDRKSIGTILADLKMDLALAKDVDVAVRVGKIAGANMMVMGSLAMIEKRYYLSVQLLDVETGEVKAASSEDAPSFKKVKKTANKIAKLLIEKLNTK